MRAGKLRAGYARSGAFAMGYALEAAVLREWGRRDAADPPSTGFGAELHGSLMFIDVGVGAYRMRTGTSQFAFSVGLVL